MKICTCECHKYSDCRMRSMECMCCRIAEHKYLLDDGTVDPAKVDELVSESIKRWKLFRKASFIEYFPERKGKKK